MPGRRRAALARKTFRTWSRCIANTPSKGLAVISLSLDDPTDKAAVAEAEKFLKDEEGRLHQRPARRELWRRIREAEHQRDPRGLLYGPDGKEVKRFTMDDPNNQFTYDEVEKADRRPP